MTASSITSFSILSRYSLQSVGDVVGRMLSFSERGAGDREEERGSAAARRLGVERYLIAWRRFSFFAYR